MFPQYQFAVVPLLLVIFVLFGVYYYWESKAHLRKQTHHLIVAMPQELYVALENYRMWISTGAPKVNQFEFSRSAGLCANIQPYLSRDNCRYLRMMFLYEQCPFNISIDAYWKEAMLDQCHLNNRRNAWVVYVLDTYLDNLSNHV